MARFMSYFVEDVEVNGAMKSCVESAVES